MKSKVKQVKMFAVLIWGLSKNDFHARMGVLHLLEMEIDSLIP